MPRITENCNCLEVVREINDEDVREVFRTSIPFTLTQAITASANIGSTFILARLGDNELAASGLITSLLMIMQGFLYGPLNAVGIISGAEFGSGNENQLKIICQQGIVFGFVLSVPYTLISLFSDKILLGFRQSQSLALISKAFFHGYAYGAWADVLLNPVQQYGTATGQQKAILVISGFQKSATIILAYLMSNGVGAMPEMRSRGIGIAFSICGVTSLVANLLYLARVNKLEISDFVSISTFKERVGILKKIFLIGFPIGLQVGFELSSMSAMLAISGLIDKHELAASQIALQYTGMIVVPIIGSAQAMGILVSTAFESGNKNKIQRFKTISNLLGIGFSSISTILLCSLTSQLPDLMAGPSHGQPGDVHRLTRNLLYINAASLIPDFFRNNYMGLLRGLEDTTVPMIVNTVVSATNIAAAYAAYKFDTGSEGIFITRTLSISLIAIMMWYRWFKIYNSKVEKQDEELSLLDNENDSHSPQPNLSNRYTFFETDTRTNSRDLENNENNPLIPGCQANNQRCGCTIL